MLTPSPLPSISHTTQNIALKMSQILKKKEKDYAALSAAYTSRIDSLIPLDFGKPKTQPNASSSKSAYVEESAEEILEKNRKARMAVKHRQVAGECQGIAENTNANPDKLFSAVLLSA